MSALLTCADVLELIDPVDPDNLQHLDGGVYEAKWSPTTPHAMDIALLQRTESIIVLGESFEPEGLLGWRAVRFKVE